MIKISLQYFGGRGGGGSGGARGGGRAGGGGGGDNQAQGAESPVTDMSKTPAQFRSLSKAKMTSVLEGAAEGSTITARVSQTTRDLAGNVLSQRMVNKTYYKDGKGWYAKGTKWGLDMQVVNTKKRVSSDYLANRFKTTATVNGLSLK